MLGDKCNQFLIGFAIDRRRLEPRAIRTIDDFFKRALARVGFDFDLNCFHNPISKSFRNLLASLLFGSSSSISFNSCVAFSRRFGTTEMLCDKRHQFLIRFTIHGWRLQLRSVETIGELFQKALVCVWFDFDLDGVHFRFTSNLI